MTEHADTGVSTTLSPHNNAAHHRRTNTLKFATDALDEVTKRDVVFGSQFLLGLTIAGLACVTVITRCFFFISEREWKLPHWAERGLQYAPIAALAAVIVPEMVMTQGHFISTWQDARLFAVAAGAAWFFWRKVRRHRCWVRFL